MATKARHRIFGTSVASVYPHYVTKAEKKGRTREEVHQVIHWLTGYDEAELSAVLENGTSFEDFFAQAPAMNPTREIRYLDKLVDELARGRKLEKILRV